MPSPGACERKEANPARPRSPLRLLVPPAPPRPLPLLAQILLSTAPLLLVSGLPGEGGSGGIHNKRYDPDSPRYEYEPSSCVVCALAPHRAPTPAPVWSLGAGPSHADALPLCLWQSLRTHHPTYQHRHPTCLPYLSTCLASLIATSLGLPGAGACTIGRRRPVQRCWWPPCGRCRGPPSRCT